MPMIWTDDNGVVTRTHYNPEELPESEQDGITVESVPTASPPEIYYEFELVYNSGSGDLSYTYTDPYDQFNLNLTNQAKVDLYKLIRSGDFHGLIDYIEKNIA